MICDDIGWWNCKSCNFTDAGDHSGVVTGSLAAKQAYTVIQRLLPYLQGLSAQGGTSVDKSNSAANFDYRNFISYVFQFDPFLPGEYGRDRMDRVQQS